jgi:hypothetical protein
MGADHILKKFVLTCQKESCLKQPALLNSHHFIKCVKSRSQNRQGQGIIYSRKAFTWQEENINIPDQRIEGNGKKV